MRTFVRLHVRLDSKSLLIYRTGKCCEQTAHRKAKHTFHTSAVRFSYASRDKKNGTHIFPNVHTY
jgi:hypothetical protein